MIDTELQELRQAAYAQDKCIEKMRELIYELAAMIAKEGRCPHCGAEKTAPTPVDWA